MKEREHNAHAEYFSYFHQDTYENETLNERPITPPSSIRKKMRILLVICVLLALLTAKLTGIGIFRDEYIKYAKDYSLAIPVSYVSSDSPDTTTQKLGSILKKQLKGIKWEHYVDTLGLHHIRVSGRTKIKERTNTIAIEYFVDPTYHIFELTQFQINSVSQPFSLYQLFIGQYFSL